MSETNGSALRNPSACHIPQPFSIQIGCQPLDVTMESLDIMHEFSSGVEFRNYIQYLYFLRIMHDDRIQCERSNPTDHTEWVCWRQHRRWIERKRRKVGEDSGTWIHEFELLYQVGRRRCWHCWSRLWKPVRVTEPCFAFEVSQSWCVLLMDTWLFTMCTSVNPVQYFVWHGSRGCIGNDVGTKCGRYHLFFFEKFISGGNVHEWCR